MKKSTPFSIFVSESSIVVTNDLNAKVYCDGNFGRVTESFASKESADLYVENELFVPEPESHSSHMQCQYDYACGYIN